MNIYLHCTQCGYQKKIVTRHLPSFPDCDKCGEKFQKIQIGARPDWFTADDEEEEKKP